MHPMASSGFAFVWRLCSDCQEDGVSVESTYTEMQLGHSGVMRWVEISPGANMLAPHKHTQTDTSSNSGTMAPNIIIA